MNGPDINETFNVNSDWTENRVRIALIGSNGTEVLVVVKCSDNAQPPSSHSEVLRLGESRLRAALLALIGFSWPTS